MLLRSSGGSPPSGELSMSARFVGLLASWSGRDVGLRDGVDGRGLAASDDRVALCCLGVLKMNVEGWRLDIEVRGRGKRAELKADFHMSVGSTTSPNSPRRVFSELLDMANKAFQE